MGSHDVNQKWNYTKNNRAEECELFYFNNVEGKVFMAKVIYNFWKGNLNRIIWSSGRKKFFGSFSNISDDVYLKKNRWFLAEFRRKLTREPFQVSNGIRSTLWLRTLFNESRISLNSKEFWKNWEENLGKFPINF